MADRRRYSYPADTAEIPQFSSSSNQQSFSSTLLDAIYREIDRGDAVYRKKKPIDEKVADPAVDVKRLRKLRANYLGSSSVDYTCGRGRYLEEESLPIRRPKAVRTVGACAFHGDREIDRRDRRGFNDGEGSEQKSTATAAKQEGGGFLKTKSRALKIYGELKKVKQPISPGGKLAVFWNSLLSTAAGGLKKPKIAASDDSPSLKSTTTNTSSSTCSSASSFSRSCLSKTTPSSSRAKSSAVGEKRSVRFFPVSVIVDEDCQPCGHKALRDVRKSSAIDEDVKVRMNKTHKIIESPFHRYTKSASINRAFDDELDGSSDSSSDLFELDNLDGSRYGQQLPVYETTDFRTNRAIANTNTSFVF